MIQINLLPWREEARKVKKHRFIAGSIASSVIAIILLILTHIYLVTVSSEQFYVNEYLRNEVKNEESAVNSTKNQQQEKIKTEDKLNKIIALKEQSYDAVRLLNELSTIVPESISLSNINRQGKTITLGGYANADTEVTQFLSALKQSPLFTNATLNQITSGADTGGKKRNFEIIAEQKEKVSG